MITHTRYVRESYKELDIAELPPGEVLQTAWNGEIIFIRRLTMTEVRDTNSLPNTTLLDKESVTTLSNAGNSEVLVCSAICTHLGCIPVPYLGAYKGWVCLCHGSVYDKFGRVRQGPAQANLPYINNSVHGPVVCIEEQQFPNEPSIFMYVWVNLIASQTASFGSVLSLSNLTWAAINLHYAARMKTPRWDNTNACFNRHRPFLQNFLQRGLIRFL